MASESTSTIPSSNSASTSVTEFSRLKIKDGLREQHKAAIEKGLARAKKGMEDFTGQKFYIFEEVENPNHIYIVGEWASLEQHMNEWIPSEENQNLLKELGPFIDVDVFFHLDSRIGDIPPSTPAPILSCGRHVMERSQRSSFEETFNKRNDCLEAHTLGAVGAGWRIEKETDREEFVLFCPWKYVIQYCTWIRSSHCHLFAPVLQYANDYLEMSHSIWPSERRRNSKTTLKSGITLYSALQKFFTFQ